MSETHAKADIEQVEWELHLVISCPAGVVRKRARETRKGLEIACACGADTIVLNDDGARQMQASIDEIKKRGENLFKR